MSDSTSVRLPKYRAYVWSTFVHTLVTTVRRKRAILAGCIALTPVVVPLALAFLSGNRFAEEGSQTFVRIVDYVFLRTMAPLMALFFGCTLIGEDVEGETIPYLLTRPLPRSAWVLGKYLAFVVIGVGLLIPAILLTFFACTTLGSFALSFTNVKLLLHYEGVMVMALFGYGAVCLLLGALVRRPVIVGVVALFAWQRLAIAVPGVIDFLTIEKYVIAMLPKLATERENIVIRTALIEFQRKVFLVGAAKAAVTLILISAFLLALTTLVVRWREYSSARAVGG